MKRDYFADGVMYAAGFLCAAFDEPGMAAALLRESAISLNAGDVYDRNAARPAIREARRTARVRAAESRKGRA